MSAYDPTKLGAALTHSLYASQRRDELVALVEAMEGPLHSAFVHVVARECGILGEDGTVQPEGGLDIAAKLLELTIKMVKGGFESADRLCPSCIATYAMQEFEALVRWHELAAGLSLPAGQTLPPLSVVLIGALRGPHELAGDGIMIHEVSRRIIL